MSDNKIPFDEAVAEFRNWLQQEGWSANLLWLTKNRITGIRNEFWLFRPEEMTDDSDSRLFYESARNTTSSIRIDAFCQMPEATIAYVDDYGGDGRHLNFGIPERPLKITHAVDSRIYWNLRRALNRIVGESPFLRYTRMTE